MRYPVTPDGRYFVMRPPVALHRSRPAAGTSVGADHQLMDARRDKGRAMRAGDAKGREEARQRVDETKQALGERGEVWWTDGAPDWNRHMARNTPYAEGFARLGV